MGSVSPPVPSLSEQGWIRDLTDKVDKLYTYAFTSMKSQSILFDGRIVSLQYILAEYGTDRHAVADELESGFNKLFRDYFEQVVVKVTTTESTDSDTYTIHIAIDVYDAGQAYSSGRLIETKSKNVLSIINV